MNKQIKNIAVVESSQIVFEGISTLLSKSGHQFHLLRINDFDELVKIMQSSRIEIAVINPSQIQNKTKEFASLKKNFSGVIWIALVYSFFDQQTISLFDKTIHITDSSETINKLFAAIISNDVSPIIESEQEQLSDREIDVLKQVVNGFSNKEIADSLNISIHTVISHRKNISQKTGIKSQSGLTIYAISNKIVLLEDFSKQN